MRLAILSSEVVPFAKTGGLADVAGALPKALTQQDHETVVILPLHQQVERRLLSDETIDDVQVNWRGKTRPTRFFQGANAAVPTYLVDAPEYFDRPSIYGSNDDHERYAFFCRAAFALCKHLKWQPDIIHGNDWPCGFAMVESRSLRRYDPFFQKTKSVFTIHNLAYQGFFDTGDLWWLGFGEQPDRDDFIFRGMASSLKAGIIAADALTTVSRKYAEEIQTPELGDGLDWLLRARRTRLVGITNGIDFETWNPETDTHIAANYSVSDVGGKRECKADLLRRFNLPQDLDRPVIAMISRLVAQKGYDLVRQLAGEILATGAFVIVLGAGAKEYEEYLQQWHQTAPRQVGVYIGYAGEPLAHQIEAGADLFLMPSHYEPCGLNQMYSMRYGTVPIVRATGGLDDTVQNFGFTNPSGNGFKFYDYTASALLDKLREALYFYGKPELWEQVQMSGMTTDNSWQAAAAKYSEFYREVIQL